MKKNLDFICIGAMRSGTTTLYELLKNHPQIALPPGKEVPFFSDNHHYEKGLDWYLRKNLHQGDNKQLWGTITPQYMYSDGVDTEETAKRIKQTLPDVKLIAILRHPIQRAFSHYNYAKRHGYDSRDFELAIDEILEEEDVVKMQNKISHQYSYLARSSYGSNLEPYYKLFDSKQILVLFTDELENRPEDTLHRIFKFLHIKSYIPEKAGKVFHKGGSRAKISLLTPGKIGKVKPIMKLYRLILPYRFRKKFEIWLHVWNIKPDNSQLDQKSATYNKLVSYFSDDIRLLKRLSSRNAPWSDWR